MARSGEFGWAGLGIWARVEGLERSKKSESRKEMGRDGRRGKILLWKAAGGIGRPFGGRGLSKYPFRT